MTNNRIGRTFRKLVFAGALTVCAAVNGQPVEAGSQSTATNYVLELDGDNSYVELPSDAFTNLSVATIEGWVKWDAFHKCGRFFDFLVGEHVFNVQNRQRTANLSLERDQVNITDSVEATGVLSTGSWVHVAAVLGPERLRLFLNGILVATNESQSAFSTAGVSQRNYLGRSNWRTATAVPPEEMDQDFRGQMDEVRVWSVQRSEEEIVANMYKRLSGNEPNLVALWNFDDPTNPGKDSTTKGHNGRFAGQAQVIAAPIPTPQAAASATPLMFRAGADEPVLALTGEESYVQLPLGILDGLTNLTVESWVRWDQSGSWLAFIRFGHPTENHKLALFTTDVPGTLRLTIDDNRSGWTGQNIDVPDVIQVGKWIHVAAVITPQGAQLYINGRLAGNNADLNLSLLETNADNHLGDGGFIGEVEELRLWKTARTEQQISENLFKKLAGTEEGLLALWNFDATDGTTVIDAGPNHFNGTLQGYARIIGSSIPNGKPWPQLQGVVADTSGRPRPGAVVSAVRTNVTIASATTDASGHFWFTLPDENAPFDVRASASGEAALEREISMSRGELKEFNLQLLPRPLLSGTVRSPEGKPLAGVLLQLIDAEAGATNRAVAVSLTGTNGGYQFRKIEPGRYRLQAQSQAGFEPFQNGIVLTAGLGDQVTNLDFTLAPAMVHRSPVSTNLVLSLNGSGSFVQLPANIFNELTEATVEGWVKWDEFRYYSRFFDFGQPQQGIFVANRLRTDTVAFRMDDGDNTDIGGLLRTNDWCHIALAMGPSGARFYCNGALLGTHPSTGSFASLDSTKQNYLGRSNWRNAPYNDEDFRGEMDEVRVWATQRSSEEIRDNMFRQLTGNEEGLVALWNFDDPGQPGRDATPHGFDGRLTERAHVQTGKLPVPDELLVPLVVRGIAIDQDGRALGNATIKLVALTAETNRLELATASSDYSGRFSITKSAQELPQETGWRLFLSASKDYQSFPGEEIPTSGVENSKVILRDYAKLSGSVLAWDDSPLPAVAVQVTPEASKRDEEVAGLWGEYFQLDEVPRKFPTLAPSALPTYAQSESTIDFPRVYGGASLGRGTISGRLYARWTGKLRLDRDMRIQLILGVEDAGRIFIDGKLVIDSGAPKSWTEPAAWVDLTRGDHELLVDYVSMYGWHGCQLWWSQEGDSREILPSTMLVHAPGNPTAQITLTDSRGRYRFTQLPPGNYTLRAQIPGDSAGPDNPKPITITKEAAVEGVDFHLSPFKKGVWQHWTHAEGLPADNVQRLFQDSSGAMWFGTAGGVTRFDGLNFRSWTKRDGLPDAEATCICEGQDGVMWFGTAKGLVRYDPKAAVQPAASVAPAAESETDKPASETTDSQVVRQTQNRRALPPGFTLFTTANGLPDNEITALERDASGQLWVGTTRGLARFDGTRFEALSGALVPDASPNNYNGVAVGNARLVKRWRPAGPDSRPDGAGEAETKPAKVLQLDGTNSYVELPPDMLQSLDAATFEGWVRWDGFENNHSHFFEFGSDEFSLVVVQDNNTPDLGAYFPTSTRRKYEPIILKGALKLRQWNHIAAVAGKDGCKLYLNGELVGTNALKANLAGIGQNAQNFLGACVKGPNPELHGAIRELHGAIAEFRIWNRERTAEQIRDSMSIPLTGAEDGLVGLWNFEEVADGLVKDASLHGHDGRMMGNARIAVDSTLGRQMPASGKQDTVLSLDGRSGHAQIPANPDFDLTTGTLEAWFKPEFQAGSVNYNPMLLGARLGDVTRYSLHVARDLSGIMLWNGAQVFRFQVPLTQDKWHHLALVAGETNSQLYIDGLPVETPGPKFGSREGLPFEIGANGKGEFFPGQMDNVRVWKVQRTPEQIRQTLHKELTGQEPGLVGLWNFADVTNGVVKDLSLRGHDGRLMGNAKIISVAGPSVEKAAPSQPMQVSTVLQTYRGDDFLSVSPAVLNGVETATIEAWLRWNGALPKTDRNQLRALALDYEGNEDRIYLIQNRERDGGESIFSIIEENNKRLLTLRDRAADFTRWNHVALVVGSGNMKLYRNGQLITSTNIGVDDRPGFRPPARRRNGQPRRCGGKGSGCHHGRNSHLEARTHGGGNQCQYVSQPDRQRARPPGPVGLRSIPKAGTQRDTSLRHPQHDQPHPLGRHRCWRITV